MALISSAARKFIPSSSTCMNSTISSAIDNIKGKRSKYDVLLYQVIITLGLAKDPNISQQWRFFAHVKVLNHSFFLHIHSTTLSITTTNFLQVAMWFSYYTIRRAVEVLKESEKPNRYKTDKICFTRIPTAVHGLYLSKNQGMIGPRIFSDAICSMHIGHIFSTAWFNHRTDSESVRTWEGKKTKLEKQRKTYQNEVNQWTQAKVKRLWILSTKPALS